MPELYVAKEGETNSVQPSKGVDEATVKSGNESTNKMERDAIEKAEISAMISEVLSKSGERPRKELGGAYTVRPGNRFVDMQSDEEVVLLLRAHPITNFKWIFLVVMAMLFVEVITLSGALNGIPGRAIFVGKLFWYLVLLGFAFEKFLGWYYSVFIVTNERVVDIDFINLLYRVVSYATLNHIEEPAMVSGGIIRSFFKYGDVSVSTAAASSTLEALAVPHPDKVIRIISELSEELEKRRENGE